MQQFDEKFLKVTEGKWSKWHNCFRNRQDETTRRQQRAGLVGWDICGFSNQCCLTHLTSHGVTLPSTLIEFVQKAKTKDFRDRGLDFDLALHVAENGLWVSIVVDDHSHFIRRRICVNCKKGSPTFSLVGLFSGGTSFWSRVLSCDLDDFLELWAFCEFPEGLSICDVFSSPEAANHWHFAVRREMVDLLLCKYVHRDVLKLVLTYMPSTK
jgi:hypothetical protein